MKEYNFNITELVGKTFSNVHVNAEKDELIFTLNDGTLYKFCHEQDCCETVSIDSITGDLNDLSGSPILIAEESSNSGDVPEKYGTETWTFYKFSTLKGYVDVRWFGESNGYYSESVDLVRIDKD